MNLLNASLEREIMLDLALQECVRCDNRLESNIRQALCSHLSEISPGEPSPLTPSNTLFFVTELLNGPGA